MEGSTAEYRPSRLNGPSSSVFTGLGSESPKAQFTLPLAFFSRLMTGVFKMNAVISTLLENKGISFTRALIPSIEANCASLNPSGLSISTRPALA